MFALSLVMVCILLGALGQISMKAGMNRMERIDGFADLLNPVTATNILKNYYIIGGLLLYLISVILWLAAMSTLDVSFMYPLLSMAYVITAIAAFLFLGETITIVRWAGIALVVAGCFLITRS
jgi:multidrug transporter EmrE-like cation transporter